MPLLCISLLVLLLLPLSLSCDSKRPHKDVRDDYRTIVETDINNANRSIATLLHNSSCPALKQKQHKCTSDNVQVVVSTLHLLTCKMKNLNISLTDGLITSVLYSIQCPCLVKPAHSESLSHPAEQTRASSEPQASPDQYRFKILAHMTTEPDVRSKRTATRRRRNKPKIRKETKKLCRAEAILSAMTNCYQMLNSILINT